MPLPDDKLHQGFGIFGLTTEDHAAPCAAFEPFAQKPRSQMAMGPRCVDTLLRIDFFAASLTVKVVRDWIVIDNLAFVLTKCLHRALGRPTRSGLCDACFTGNCPNAIPA